PDPQGLRQVHPRSAVMSACPASRRFTTPNSQAPTTRRDSLGGFWKDAFGNSHAILVVNAFLENVSRHAMEHRELAPGEKEENVVL
ncbi:MAG TPA: hypothetical protein VHL61_11455, partial [Luteimonas sp.]|nr:hypothetical protein [Luteimonas sp.]